MYVYYVKTADNKWDVYSQDGSVANGKITKSAQMSFDSNGNTEGVYNYTALGTTPETRTMSATANANPAINVTTDP